MHAPSGDLDRRVLWTGESRPSSGYGIQLIAGFDLLRTDESTVTFVSMRRGMDSCGNRMVCNGVSVDYQQ